MKHWSFFGRLVLPGAKVKGEHHTQEDMYVCVCVLHGDKVYLLHSICSVTRETLTPFLSCGARHNKVWSNVETSHNWIGNILLVSYQKVVDVINIRTGFCSGFLSTHNIVPTSHQLLYLRLCVDVMLSAALIEPCFSRFKALLGGLNIKKVGSSLT